MKHIVEKDKVEIEIDMRSILRQNRNLVQLPELKNDKTKEGINMPTSQYFLRFDEL